ncbi:hypothetical protein THRCLA_02406 [Thraustotheca clavata]|uniref:Uncharacterized protein n=1 Tax=Thraustotheca clavata TaxID=74557 RepID=A0A1W0A5K7_9STRA|nr:hypothetical protein THRCLA_02406 [Thraustotheca clavata]
MRFERVKMIESNEGTLIEDEHSCKYSTREILYDVRDELERSSDPEYIRRKLHRERIRDYRRSKVMEMKKLQQEAEELQVYIARAKKTKKIAVEGSLPWEEVALALQEATYDSKCNNAKLRSKVQKQRQLVQIMSKWVSMMVHVERSPNANLSTWRNVCLFQSDESRKLGFEWMTNHMLHHTNNVLDQCEFPSDVTLNQTNYLDLQCVWEDSGRYRLYQKHQTIFFTSLEKITKALHQLYISNRVSVANVEKEDLDIQFLNDSGRYSRTQQWSANPLHFLRRQFIEPGHRSIIVGQNILEDEKYPVGKYIGDAQAWIVVTQLQAGVILYQNYYTAEQLHTKEGTPLPIEQDALFAAVNLQNQATEQEKRDAFFHQIRSQWTQIIKGAEDAIRMMCLADSHDSAM